MITDKGKSLIADYIVSTFVKGDVGSGGNTTNPAQLELDVPLLTTKATVIPVKSDENVIDFKMTIQGSAANISGRSLRECGIFDAANNMLARFNFDAIGPFSSSEEVEFFIAVEVE
tara:strand:- start:81 stop:428 length:348 start_codon:yes stop_codon:yes gene_type:complete